MWLASGKDGKGGTSSLVGDELSYLFGEGDVVLMNPRNGNDTRFLLLLFKLRAHSV